jgi:hypothetical protein
VTFVIENHITLFLVTFHDYVATIYKFFILQMEWLFTLFSSYNVFVWPISCKSDQKMVTNTYLYIKLCMLLILYRVSHAFYVMVINNYV